MSKFFSWLWSDGEKPKTPVRSPRPNASSGTSEEFLSPASAANLQKAQKVIDEIEEIIRKELDILASTKLKPESENVEPHSGSNSPRAESPKRRSRRSSLSARVKQRGPRLIRSLNKSKQRIRLGDMEYDPEAGVWNGNDDALNVFAKTSPRLINPQAAASLPKNVNGMVWDPAKKVWKGNEEELNRFSFNRLGLITNVSGNLLSGMAMQSSMTFNPATLRWEGGDYDNPFENVEEASIDKWEVGPDFELSAELKEQFRQCAQAHAENLSNWFKDSRSKYRTLRTDSLRQLVLDRLGNIQKQIEEIEKSGETPSADSEEHATQQKAVVDESDDWGDIDISSIRPGLKFTGQKRQSDTDDSDLDRALQRAEEKRQDSLDEEDWGADLPESPVIPAAAGPTQLPTLNASLTNIATRAVFPQETKPSIDFGAWVDDPNEQWSSHSEPETKSSPPTPKKGSLPAVMDDSDSDLEIPTTFLPKLPQSDWASDSAEFPDDDEFDAEFVPLDREKEVFFEDWSDVEVPTDLDERKPNIKKQKVIIALPTTTEEPELFDDLAISPTEPLVLKLNRPETEESSGEDDWNGLVVDKLAAPDLKKGPTLISPNSIPLTLAQPVADDEMAGFSDSEEEPSKPKWDDVGKRWITEDEDPFAGMSDDEVDAGGEDDDDVGPLRVVNKPVASNPVVNIALPLRPGLNLIQPGDLAKLTQKAPTLQPVADSEDPFSDDDDEDLVGTLSLKLKPNTGEDEELAGFSDDDEDKGNPAPLKLALKPTTDGDDEDDFAGFSDDD